MEAKALEPRPFTREETIAAFRLFLKWNWADGMERARKMGDPDETVASIFRLAKSIAEVMDLPHIEQQTAAIQLAIESGKPDPMLLIQQYQENVKRMLMNEAQMRDNPAPKQVFFSQPKIDKYFV